MKTLIALLLSMVLAGCSAQQITKLEMDGDPMIAGKSDDYRDGFRQGCQSGIKEGRGWMAGDDFVRDDERMKLNADYALGWNDGARRCAGRFGGNVLMTPARR